MDVRSPTVDDKGGSSMARAFVTTVLAAVIASGIPATAHHSNALYFDVSKTITLEGEVLRVEWINPHVLLFLETKNDEGQSETWILHGSSLNNALRQVGSMKEQLKPGTLISARAWPPRNPLFLNDAQAVHLTRADDARSNSRIAGAGEIRFSNGDVVAFGGGPKF
jgi:Family of unknown function (DUF6152)